MTSMEAVLAKHHKHKKAANDDNEMTLERLQMRDVNGLMGKSWRNPITGQIKIRDVGAERDFSLVDVKQRWMIHGTTKKLANDEHLYLPRAMNYRTWVYHDRFKEAESSFKVGCQKEEAFLWQALGERCIDCQDLHAGMWSSAMIYLPVVPFTILADSTIVLLLMGFMTAFCMLASVATNSAKWYFWTRAITAPVRFIVMIVILASIKGDGLNIVGFIVPFVAIMADFLFGDIKLLCSGQYYCKYELMQALPNQVFICRRKGDSIRRREPRKLLSESMTGIMDTTNEVCVIANLQGLLVEMVPVDGTMDFDMFDLTHTQLQMNPSLPKVRYMGVDVFIGQLNSAHAYKVQEINMENYRKRQKEIREAELNNSSPKAATSRAKGKNGDTMKLEDIV